MEDRLTYGEALRRAYVEPDCIGADGLHWKRAQGAVALEYVEGGRALWRQAIRRISLEAARPILLREFEQWKATRT